MTREEALAYFTPHVLTKGPVMLDPEKMREGVAVLQGASSGPGCRPDGTSPSVSSADAASIPRAWVSVSALLDKFWLASAVLDGARAEHVAKLEEQRRYGMRKPKSDETLDRVAAARVCFEHAVKALREAQPAPGGEARSAETGTGSAEGKHPVAEGEALEDYIAGLEVTEQICLDKLKSENAELREALQWYVKNDDVVDGDPGNQFWIAGRDRARTLLSQSSEGE